MKRTRRTRIFKGGFSPFPDIDYMFDANTRLYLKDMVNSIPEIKNNPALNHVLPLALYISSFRVGGDRGPPPPAGTNLLYDKLHRKYEEYMMAM